MGRRSPPPPWPSYYTPPARDLVLGRRLSRRPFSARSSRTSSSDGGPAGARFGARLAGISQPEAEDSRRDRRTPQSPVRPSRAVGSSTSRSCRAPSSVATAFSPAQNTCAATGPKRVTSGRVPPQPPGLRALQSVLLLRPRFEPQLSTPEPPRSRSSAGATGGRAHHILARRDAALGRRSSRCPRPAARLVAGARIGKHAVAHVARGGRATSFAQAGRRIPAQGRLPLERRERRPGQRRRRRVRHHGRGGPARPTYRLPERTRRPASSCSSGPDLDGVPGRLRRAASSPASSSTATGCCPAAPVLAARPIHTEADLDHRSARRTTRRRPPGTAHAGGGRPPRPGRAP